MSLAKRSMHREETPGPRERRGARAKLARARILVTDDTTDNRELYAEYLRFEGYEVVMAEDGAKAIELARASRLDLIVMDLALPVVDGWEAIERLKRDVQTKGVPIVAVTGHVEAAHRKRALAAGCDRYLTKPLLPADLFGAIEELLKR